MINVSSRRVPRALLAPVLVTITVAGCTPPTGQVTIGLDPAGTSIDRSLPVHLEGLVPGERVILRAGTTAADGGRWASAAELVANGAGTVHTATDPSRGGTYRGVDVDGPFWSMRPPSGVVTASSPFVGVDGQVVDLEVARGDAVLARTSARRTLGDPAADVSSTPVAGNGLVGDLYVPRGRPGPHPGVLLLGGSLGGRPDPAYATLLASRGYVVLGMAYFRADGLAPELRAIPVEYGLAGADYLAGRPEVGGRPIAVHGTSKGAEYALLLATSAPRRFAAIVPSDVVWPALSYDGSPARSYWTRGGADVPYLPPAETTPTPPPAPGTGTRFAGDYAEQYAAATPQQRSAARIPVERVEAPVLLVSGGDDGVWPSTAQAERAFGAIRAAGDRFGARRAHPGAGHAVGGVPHLPSTSSLTRGGPILFESGGAPEPTDRARSGTDAAVSELFARALG